MSKRLISQNDVPSGLIPLMVYLLDNPYRTVPEVAKAIDLSNNTVAHRMRTLFANGYATCRDTYYPRREYRLTKKGEDVAKGLHWIMVLEDREEFE